MPRFKPIHKGLKLLPVDFDRQIQPGSFEYALRHLVDQELDLADFHARYNNDEVVASAYDPAVLLKIILLASGVRQLIRQLFDFVKHEFKTLHYNRVNCCVATGFFTRRALNTSLLR